MKKSLWVIAVILGIMASCAASYSLAEVAYPPSQGKAMDPGAQQYPGNPQTYDQNYPGSPQQYGQNEDTSYVYDRLAPYGNWIYLNPYGYVWIPRHMTYGWRPYSDGHWVYTDYGWTWISDQEWGDIPFHYGRWGYDNYIGWFWVPGTVWGPAWVSWRSNDQYMGWAPLPPGVEFGPGMNFNSISIAIPINFWIFIQGSHFQDPYLNSYVLPYERNWTLTRYTTLHNNMYERNNRIINEGIGVDEVRRITRRAVPTYRLQDARQPGRPRVVGREVQLFRPTIRENKVAKPKVYMNDAQARQELAPAKVFDPRDIRTIDTEAAAVQKRQIEEKRLLEISQAEEIKNMQQKRDAEALKLRDASAKIKVQKDYEAEIVNLKKTHAVETQKLTVRHQNDAAQVKQVTQIKKVTQVKKITQTQPIKKKKIN